MEMVSSPACGGALTARIVLERPDTDMDIATVAEIRLGEEVEQAHPDAEHQEQPAEREDGGAHRTAEQQKR
ncbi:MAG TPA: hypothetical protein VJO36_06390 [Actinomycetota bacterium]|nr:hypothetical protein [Actinomycetota bacterium]